MNKPATRVPSYELFTDKDLSAKVFVTAVMEVVGLSHHCKDVCINCSPKASSKFLSIYLGCSYGAILCKNEQFPSDGTSN